MTQLPLTTIMRHPFASKRYILVFRDTGEEIKEVFELRTQYEAIAPIGQGTFGFVCSARDNDKVNEFKLTPPEEYTDPDLSNEEKEELYEAYTLVAIKKLRQLFENNQPRMWLCATREIQLMMSFQHENVMSAIDFFIPLGGVETMTYDFIRDLRETFDSVYVVMKKMDYTLREVLDSCTVTVDEAKDYAQNIRETVRCNVCEVCGLDGRERNCTSGTTCSTCDEYNTISQNISDDKLAHEQCLLCNEQVCSKCDNNASCTSLNGNNNDNNASVYTKCTLFDNNTTTVTSINGIASNNSSNNTERSDAQEELLIETSEHKEQRNNSNNCYSINSSSNNSVSTSRDCTSIDNDEAANSNTNTNNNDGDNRNGCKETSESADHLLRCPCTGLVLHPLSRDYRKFVLYQIFRGVGYLHLCPVIHRDLKPENIMLDRSYNTRITDFGQGRQINVGESEYAATVLDTCTQWYAAPETLSPLASSAMGFIDHATFHGVDVWSIGCIAAEMLMGRPLFYCAALGGLMHLKTIINVLGTPTQEDVESIVELREKTNCEIFLIAVKKALSTCCACTPQLRQMLKSPYCDEDEDEIELICNCLTWNPHKRIRIQAALESPYFAKDGYDPVIDPDNVNKRVPSVHPSDISEPVSGRSFLWDLFVQRHPEVQELWESLERRHNSSSSVDVICDENESVESEDDISDFNINNNNKDNNDNNTNTSPTNVNNIDLCECVQKNN